MAALFEPYGKAWCNLQGRNYYWKLADPTEVSWEPPAYGKAWCHLQGRNYYWHLDDPTTRFWERPVIGAFTVHESIGCNSDGNTDKRCLASDTDDDDDDIIQISSDTDDDVWLQTSLSIVELDIASDIIISDIQMMKLPSKASWTSPPFKLYEEMQYADLCSANVVRLYNIACALAPHMDFDNGIMLHTEVVQGFRDMDEADFIPKFALSNSLTRSTEPSASQHESRLDSDLLFYLF
tara:strand:- start:1336 stop:2046 length:711 start_codon:yes stop_codon:yes gene_type:complete